MGNTVNFSKGTTAQVRFALSDGKVLTDIGQVLEVQISGNFQDRTILVDSGTGQGFPVPEPMIYAPRWRKKSKTSQVYVPRRRFFTYITIAVYIDDYCYPWVYNPQGATDDEKWQYFGTFTLGSQVSQETILIKRHTDSKILFMCRSDKLVYQRLAVTIYLSSYSKHLVRELVSTATAYLHDWSVWESGDRENTDNEDRIFEKLQGWLPIPEGTVPTVSENFGSPYVWGPEGDEPSEENGIWNVFVFDVDTLFTYL
jgi:hypothetical protein